MVLTNNRVVRNTHTDTNDQLVGHPQSVGLWVTKIRAQNIDIWPNGGHFRNDKGFLRLSVFWHERSTLSQRRSHWETLSPH